MNAPGVRLNSRRGACCGAVIPVPSAVADRHAERVLENRCAFCLQPFEPTRPHQRFCRPSSRKAHFDQRRERRPDLFLACADAIESAVFDNWIAGESRRPEAAAEETKTG
jgi:hypothetical protein